MGLFRNAFQALPLSAAVVDGDGVIVAVNRAWRDFAICNGGPEDGYLGCNYLEAAHDRDDPHTHALAKGLDEILSGRRDSLSSEYPCHSPDEKRWFLLQAGRLEVDGENHLLVTHTDITRRYLAEEAARHEAEHDDLTGLLLRKSFVQRAKQALERAERNRTRVAVFFVDLDGFKQINDTVGHHAGDQVLRELGTRMRACLRRPDGIARLGGDEFAIFAEDVDRRTAECIAGRLHEVFDEPFEVGTTRLRLSGSVGVGFYPTHGRDMEALVYHADRAMYQAKKAGAGLTRYAGDSPVDEGASDSRDSGAASEGEGRDEAAPGA